MLWLEEQLGLGDNAVNAMWDDKNGAWEDIPFDDDIQLTLWAQKDDIESNEILPTQIEAQNAPEKREEVEKQVPVKLDSVAYRYARIHLFEILDGLTQKKKEVTTQDAFVKKGLYKILPHEYFTREERLAWRIQESLEKKVWITLPGPAEWWNKYSEDAFQRYWDIPFEERFKVMVQFVRTLFDQDNAPDAPEDVDKVMECIYAILNFYE